MCQKLCETGVLTLHLAEVGSQYIGLLGRKSSCNLPQIGLICCSNTINLWLLVNNYCWVNGSITQAAAVYDSIKVIIVLGILKW